MRRGALGIALLMSVVPGIVRAAVSGMEIVPHQSINMRIADCDPFAVSDGIIAVAADEGEQSRDMNHNHSTGDRVLVWYDTANGALHNTHITSRTNVGIDHGLIVFTLVHTDGTTTVALYALKDTPFLKKGLVDTGYAVDRWGGPGRKSVSSGKVIFQNTQGQVVLYDVATATAQVIAQGGEPTISGNVVVFTALSADGVSSTIHSYDLTTGTVTDTGVPGSHPVTDGSGIVFMTTSWTLGYYDLQTTQFTDLGFTSLETADAWGFQDGVITMSAWEGDYWGDLNGDGVNYSYGGYLVVYDVKTGRLVNTRTPSCCGGDIDNGIVVFDVYEGQDGVQTDLNGDGDAGDCVAAYLPIQDLIQR